MTTKYKSYLLCISLLLVFTYSQSFAKEVTSSNPIMTMKKSSKSQGIGDRIETLVRNFTTYAEKDIKDKNGIDVIFNIKFSSIDTIFVSTDVDKVRRSDSKYVIPLTLNPLDFNSVEISEDSLALALCHELGHHRKNLDLLRLYGLSSPYTLNESWADWFSIDNCMNYFRDAKGLKYIKETKIPEEVKIFCKKQNLDNENFSLCERASTAALNLVSALQEKNHQVAKVPFQKVSLLKNASLDSFEKVPLLKNGSLADTAVYYPEDQCRLDVYKTQISCYLKNEGICEKPACWAEDIDY